MNVFLYHTSGCHLCELAETEIAHSQTLDSPQPSFDLIKIDIALDDDLVERFGVKIPVVRVEGKENTLDWPFTAEDFSRYINPSI